MARKADARSRFGTELAAARGRSGMTQRSVVAALREIGYDYSTQTVSGWESGTYAPEIDVVIALEMVLGVEGRLTEALGLQVPVSWQQFIEARLDRIESHLGIGAVREITKQGRTRADRAASAAARLVGGRAAAGAPATTTGKQAKGRVTDRPTQTPEQEDEFR